MPRVAPACRLCVFSACAFFCWPRPRVALACPAVSRCGGHAFRVSEPCLPQARNWGFRGCTRGPARSEILSGDCGGEAEGLMRCLGVQGPCWGVDWPERGWRTPPADPCSGQFKGDKRFLTRLRMEGRPVVGPAVRQANGVGGLALPASIERSRRCWVRRPDQYTQAPDLALPAARSSCLPAAVKAGIAGALLPGGRVLRSLSNP